MNFQQLRYAHAVCQYGSFVKAARHCGVTQPTLSNGIAQLEQELSGQLFARTTRAVRMSEFGRLVMPCISDVMNAQAALRTKAREISNPQLQHVRIGVSPIIGINLTTVILDPFRRSNPKVEIIFRETNLAEMVRMQGTEQLDFVFGPCEPTAVRAAGTETVRLHEEALRFVSERQVRLGSGTTTLKEIAGQTLVMVPDACGLAQVIRATFRKNRLKIREYAGEAMSYSVLLEWAKLGIGAAVLPASKLAEGVGAEILVQKGKSPRAKIAYQVSWQSSATRIPAVKLLAMYLKDVAPQIVSGLHWQKPE